MMFEKGRVVIVLVVTLILSSYLTFLTWMSSSLIEVWSLDSVIWETVATIVVITLLSYTFFRDSATIIILIVQVFLVVTTPVLKYPNALNLVGPWDSAAHFSFAKWIIVNEHIDTAGNLYYSRQYGFHPGNGVIPATLSLISSMDLGWCMRLVLIAIYSGYTLFLLATLERMEGFLKKNINATKALWPVAIFTLIINLSVYYGGSELGYAYAPSILHIFVLLLVNKKVASFRDVILTFLIFLGLMFTHLSTAIILVAYVSIVTLILFIAGLLNKDWGIRKSGWSLLLLTFLMISVLIVYEVFVDVLLYGSTLRGVLHRILSLYVQEVEKAFIAMEVRDLAFMHLLQYLVSHFTKAVVIAGILLAHTFVLLMRWRSLSSVEKTLAVLLFALYSTYVIGWAGAGWVLFEPRSLSVICFILTLSLALTYERFYRSLIKAGSFILPIILIVIGYITNFGLPSTLTIKAGEDTYTYPTRSQGAINNYVLHSILYLSSYDIHVSFLCLQPYTGFGLCDIMWRVPKIPEHGFIAPKITSSDEIINIVKDYMCKNVLVPQPTRDRVHHGPIGYNSLYIKTHYFFIREAKALIYSNKLYTIFLV